jgi:hypothetical protein
MSQPTSLSSALGRQACLVKYNINLLACSAPGQQTCRLAHEDVCLKNWANVQVTEASYVKIITLANQGYNLVNLRERSK